MRRRESIGRISRFLGLAAYFPALAGLLEGCAEKQDPLWVPLKLTEKQRSLIGGIAETIIPATDTPGATDAGVPAFIEILLQDVFPRQDARDLLKDLEQFNAHCKSASGKDFLESTAAQKQDWMNTVLNTTHADYDLFRKMKGLVVGAYFTSEVGIKENLHYLPIPGKFEVCQDLEKFNKVLVGDRL